MNNFGTIWKQKFSNITKPITHHILVSQPLGAVLFLKQFAVCKSDAHTSNTDQVSQENARADAAAKAAACQQLTMSEYFLHDEPNTPSTPTAVYLTFTTR